MGTYDTRGGHPISPPADEPAISPVAEKVLELLEDAGLDIVSINDQICELIEKAEEQKAMEDLEERDLRRQEGR